MSCETYAAARGRWRHILPALGVPERVLNRKNQPCPMCGGTDRFQFTDRQGDGDYICRQCGAGKGMGLLMKLRGWQFAQAANEVDKIIGHLPPGRTMNGHAKPRTSLDELRQMWKAARTVSPADPVGLYLAARGIDADSILLAPLRSHGALMHHQTKTIHPAMLARICDAEGVGRQIQRLYLTRDGHKAEVVPVRMFMPGELPPGGAIRLGPVRPTMGVAEGIENALSAAILHGMPVWATTSAGMLERWQPPPEITTIAIFGDADESHVGQAAAHILARRLIFEAGRDKLARDVHVILPPIGQDWNDILVEKGTPPASTLHAGGATAGTTRTGQ